VFLKWGDGKLLGTPKKHLNIEIKEASWFGDWLILKLCPKKLTKHIKKKPSNTYN